MLRKQHLLRIQFGEGLGRCTAGPGCSVAWHAGDTADLQRNLPPVKRISEKGFSSTETLCWKSSTDSGSCRLPCLSREGRERGRAAGCFK